MVGSFIRVGPQNISLPEEGWDPADTKSVIHAPYLHPFTTSHQDLISKRLTSRAGQYIDTVSYCDMTRDIVTDFGYRYIVLGRDFLAEKSSLQ